MSEPMTKETLNNIRRLAYALYCTTGDTAAIQQLARILRYEPTQLEKDINDLEAYSRSLNNGSEADE